MYVEPEELLELVDESMRGRDTEIRDMLLNTFAKKDSLGPKSVGSITVSLLVVKCSLRAFKA